MKIPIEYTLKEIGALNLLLMRWSRVVECSLNGHQVNIIDNDGKKLRCCAFCGGDIFENIINYEDAIGKPPVALNSVLLEK